MKRKVFLSFLFVALPCLASEESSWNTKESCVGGMYGTLLKATTKPDPGGLFKMYQECLDRQFKGSKRKYVEAVHEHAIHVAGRAKPKTLKFQQARLVAFRAPQLLQAEGSSAVWGWFVDLAMAGFVAGTSILLSSSPTIQGFVKDIRYVGPYASWVIGGITALIAVGGAAYTGYLYKGKKGAEVWNPLLGHGEDDDEDSSQEFDDNSGDEEEKEEQL